jgi:NAD(P)-dependent dehydrogenase (short-subunit alcohol dehydrogenase family)
MIRLDGKTAAVVGLPGAAHSERLAHIETALANAGAPPADVDAASIVVIVVARRVPAPFLDTAPDDWQAVASDQFAAALSGAQTAARAMIAAGRGGRIIFVTGIECLLPFRGASMTGTFFTMIWGMAKMAAVDLAPYRITVNVVAPGFTARDLPQQGSSGDIAAHIASGHPTGTLIAPSDVENAVLFLASDMAAAITGQVIAVDHGYTLTKSPGQSMLER